ncbi:hypothetical protein HBN50_11245 [Halobacteriovorax sp. GB3]|uniref:hypothetical protein n=1 Tax=Halobacteriovorax sp. GB3 TaxID=2719615 RepID=UPI00235FBE51|nr:hypothetical protein [Halobacteriovorax sp. GB3]MDD0853675.1 hypothetical protein [Halobacteriovorax sp. GB3]
MKYLLPLFLIMSFYSSARDFWPNKKVSISNKIITQEGLDAAEFNEMYSRTTSDLRKEYVQEAIQLMMAGALGPEALKMITTFDDRVYDRRQVSKKGMGNTLAGHFRSALARINEEYEFEGGNPKVRMSSRTEDYDASIVWGASSHAQIYAILTVKNKRTGMTKSYSAYSHVSRVGVIGKQLALQVFHSAHATQFPTTLEVGYRKMKVSGIRTYTSRGYTQYKTLIDQVSNYCRSKGARLPSVNELTSLFSRGLYHGGLSMGQKTEWAAMNHGMRAYVNSQYPQGNTGSLTDSPFNRTITYFCVKE